MTKWQYNFNSKNKYPAKIVLKLSTQLLFDIEDWLKNNMGQYGEKWIWWGTTITDLSHGIVHPKEIYFTDETYAMAFKLRWHDDITKEM